MNFKKFIGIAIILAVIGSFIMPQFGQVQTTMASDCPGKILVGWFSYAEWELMKDTPGYTFHATSDWGGYVCGEIVPPPPPVDVCVNIEGQQDSVPPGYILVNGNCIIPPPVCEEGEELINGVCVEIPPPPPECKEGQVLVDGVCVEPPVECETPDILVDGVCQPPPEDCEHECVPPQKEDLVCINYFASDISQITTVDGQRVSFWSSRNPATSETVINFDDGHLRNEALQVTLVDGEIVDLQMWAGFSAVFETWQQVNCMKAQLPSNQSSPTSETAVVTVVNAAIVPGTPCPE